MCWVLWYTPLIIIPQRHRQVIFCKFKDSLVYIADSLVYIASSKPTTVIQYHASKNTIAPHPSHQPPPPPLPCAWNTFWLQQSVLALFQILIAGSLTHQPPFFGHELGRVVLFLIINICLKHRGLQRNAQGKKRAAYVVPEVAHRVKHMLQMPYDLNFLPGTYSRRENQPYLLTRIIPIIHTKITIFKIKFGINSIHVWRRKPALE